MISEQLQKARVYEEIEEQKKNPNYCQEFHLMPRIGWMNDPNGVCYYNGKYHMFYQYHPYSTQWGPMHWGHAVSEDLLHWENLPAALAPDMEYDKNGCFSGSAVELADGRHLLMYTGVLLKEWEDGVVRDVQRQCVAVGDGVNYEKYEGNPVLDEKDLPEGASKQDFRDPRIWKQEDGTYLCMIGSRPADGSGQILLYSSKDGFDWKYEKVLAANGNRYGKMWECPDFFTLDGKGVLLTSPQDMLPEGTEFFSGNGTLCIIGDWNAETYDFTEENHQSIDYGMDFYAPQTVDAPDGRKIMIGWMQNWDTLGYRRPDTEWYGQMSLPREIAVKDGRLWQWPLRELENLRQNPVAYQDMEVAEAVSLEEIAGRKIDLEINLASCSDEACTYKKFELRFAQDENCHMLLSFDTETCMLKMDRMYSGFRRAMIHERTMKVNSENGTLQMRLILDTCSAELFVNGGEHAMTMTFYTEPEANGITFAADGKVQMSVKKYDLKA